MRRVARRARPLIADTALRPSPPLPLHLARASSSQAASRLSPLPSSISVDDDRRKRVTDKWANPLPPPVSSRPAAPTWGQTLNGRPLPGASASKPRPPAFPQHLPSPSATRGGGAPSPFSSPLASADPSVVWQDAAPHLARPQGLQSQSGYGAPSEPAHYREKRRPQAQSWGDPGQQLDFPRQQNKRGPQIPLAPEEAQDRMAQWAPQAEQVGEEAQDRMARWAPQVEQTGQARQYGYVDGDRTSQPAWPAQDNNNQGTRAPPRQDGQRGWGPARQDGRPGWGPFQGQGNQNQEPEKLDKKEKEKLKKLRKLESMKETTKRDLQMKHKTRHSLQGAARRDDGYEEDEFEEERPARAQQQQQRKPKVIEPVTRDVFIPQVVSVSNLARILDMRQKPMMSLMQRYGMENVKPDLLLPAEDASLIAMELGYNPIVDDEAAFDIYPELPHPDPTTLPHRPPVVTIMGHVDHGKTTLLDTLRSTSVAKGEAGGITQHIGAFCVPVRTASDASAIKTITFLDTPGHAAFTAMRARGASVTDIIVCVVAADDGVMPQTREVLALARRDEAVQLVVAINKVDKPGADVDKVKNALLVEGVQLEDLGGDVPGVEVSGLTGAGLDDLVETISALAEVADLRAARTAKAEGYVLESRVDKGRGPIATVLVMRGTLSSGASIVAGLTWCRVRQMMDDKGKIVREAGPGMPVTVAGWKELPSAGDEVLQAVGGEEDAKKAIGNRRRELEKRLLLQDVERINEVRRAERDEREEEALAQKQAGRGHAHAHAHQERAPREEEQGPRQLRLVVKGDVSGTVEAVVGAVSGIGNGEVITKVVSSGVGDVVESDVAMADTAGAMIVGFNVKAARSIQQQAAGLGVPLYFDDVIYRVMEEVRKRASALLPPAIEKHVKGEAQIQQIFTISLKQRKTRTIAGCRVTNGAIEKASRIRVMRHGREMWAGAIDELKHVKKDIQEARKGMECGMSFVGFEQFMEGDVIQAIEVKEVPRFL